MHPHDGDPVIRLDRPEPASDVVEFGATGRPPTRRRWILPTVLAAVVAMAALAYTRGDGHPAAQPSPTAEPTTASPPAEPTTGAATPTAAEVTQLGAPLFGITASWELFGRTGVEVVRIEPASGRITRTPVPSIGSDGPVTFVTTPNGVLVRPLDSVPGYLVRDGQPATLLKGLLTTNGPVLPGPTPSTFWLPRTSPTGDTVIVVDANGSATGASVRLPSGIDGYLRPDGSGNLLLLGTGGVYALGLAGIHRISTGRLLATGQNQLLTFDCDDVAACTLVVTTKATGARRSLGAPPVTPAYSTGAISPNGRTAAVLMSNSDMASVHLLDMATGTLQMLDIQVQQDYDDQATMVWSPDSRWLFIAAQGGTLHAIEAATGKDHQDPRLPTVFQLAIRPAPTS
jgi:hypothetical protein